MGFAKSLHLECTNCEYTGGSVYSSPRLHDSAQMNVAFEINTVMAMLVHELGKGHAALQKFQTVLGLNNAPEDISFSTAQPQGSSSVSVCG